MSSESSEMQTTAKWILSLFLPGIMMVIQSIYFIATCLLHPQLTLSLNLSRLQSKSFALSWKRFGKVVADDFPSPKLDDIIVTQCRGVVLDIGPGTGFQLKRFSTAASRPGQIKGIYGVEPGVDMHGQLKREAAKVWGGNGDNYVILSCGAQPDELVPVLAKQGILGQQVKNGETGEFDTIVSIRALCGIPEPKETVALFYKLLKPGGTLIFFEHVVNSGDGRKGGTRVARVLQHLYMLVGWSLLSGGCELMRDTEQFVIDAARRDGGWAVKEIHRRNAAGCIPEIYGYVQKRK